MTDDKCQAGLKLLQSHKDDIMPTSYGHISDKWQMSICQWFENEDYICDKS